MPMDSRGGRVETPRAEPTPMASHGPGGGSMDSHRGRVEMHRYVPKAISPWLSMGIGRKCYQQFYTMAIVYLKTSKKCKKNAKNGIKRAKILL